MANSATQAEEIKVLTVDGATYVVSELPDELQRLVQIYNLWRQQQVDARLNLMQIESALRNLSNELVLALRKSQDEDMEDDEPEA